MLCPPIFNNNYFLPHFLSKSNFNIYPFTIVSINTSKNQHTTCS